MTTSTSPKKKRRGITPWLPNQHGAWYMLITPAVLGAIGSDRGIPVTLAIIVAWILGYFAFFALTLAAKAKTMQRRMTYLKPFFVYGAVSLVAIVVALYLQPSLWKWAFGFGPLVLIAVYETYKGRPRSVASGVSSAVAAAMLVPVLVDGMTAVWCGVVLALQFSGTIFFVKTMIRERGNPFYLKVSIIYHIVALALTIAIATQLGWLPGLLLIISMAAALARAILVPWSADHGKKWSPKRVGQLELPMLLLSSFAVLIAFFQ